MNGYTPLDPAWLKNDSKMRTQGRTSYFAIASLLGIISMYLSSITRTETVLVGDEYVRIATTTNFSSLFSLIVAPVITVAICRFYLAFLRYGEAGNEDLKSVIPDYGKILVGMIWQKLIVALYTLMLIVPGIIKAMATSMTPYVLADNPDLGYREGVKISEVLTDGRKMEIFKVMLSFLGWLILVAITAGIAGFFIMPWYQTCMCEVYENLKADAVAQGRIDPSVFVRGGITF
ncbi:MAG: DUF975 family protein [Eubacteriaceae bacterium]|nr:DUF975 family protein [Eubacteriaceae bacterium]